MDEHCGNWGEDADEVPGGPLSSPPTFLHVRRASPEVLD
jgi:hypothetical protein